MVIVRLADWFWPAWALLVTHLPALDNSTGGISLGISALLLASIAWSIAPSQREADMPTSSASGTGQLKVSRELQASFVAATLTNE